MDPLACWIAILSDWESGLIDEARERVKDLIRWLKSGGFQPEAVPSVESLRQILNVIV